MRRRSFDAITPQARREAERFFIDLVGEPAAEGEQIPADSVVTLYAHLQARDVQVGDQVAAGQQIGRVGNPVVFRQCTSISACATSVADSDHSTPAPRPRKRHRCVSTRPSGSPR